MMNIRTIKLVEIGENPFATTITTIKRDESRKKLEMPRQNTKLSLR